MGEAEGKDNKAINVDKLRQLAMNIHEDLEREDVTSPAKGVLFGNGYRLSAPEARDSQFTAKCISAAQSANTALVPTTELCEDADYAKRCRAAILTASGVVSLPPPPEAPQLTEAVSDDTA